MDRQFFIERAVPSVINNMNETRHTSDNSIIFPNGWVASIVKNAGVEVYSTNGHYTDWESRKKYSVAICDYDGYFNWDILNAYGAIKGCIYCDNEDEICAALSIIESL